MAMLGFEPHQFGCGVQLDLTAPILHLIVRLAHGNAP